MSKSSTIKELIKKLNISETSTVKELIEKLNILETIAVKEFINELNNDFSIKELKEKLNILETIAVKELINELNDDFRTKELKEKVVKLTIYTKSIKDIVDCVFNEVARDLMCFCSGIEREVEETHEVIIESIDENQILDMSESFNDKEEADRLTVYVKSIEVLLIKKKEKLNVIFKSAHKDLDDLLDNTQEVFKKMFYNA